MNKILISTSSFHLPAQDSVIRNLEKQGYQIVMNPFGRKCTQAEITLLLDEYVVGLIAGVEPLPHNVLSSAKNLKVISRCGVGLDNVDLDAAEALQIKVYNTPCAPVDAVAELTIGLMLDVLRHITASDRSMRQTLWQPLMGRLLSRQTVGIVGYGRIGKKVVSLLEAFQCNVLIHDPLRSAEYDERFVDITELLQRSDVVSLHCPGTPENTHYLDEKKLDLMRPGSVLINTARGGLIDEHALYRKLCAKEIGRAALDVFSQEPYKGELTGLPNVLLTAHMGSYAKEARVQMETEAMSHLLQGLQECGLIP